MFPRVHGGGDRKGTQCSRKLHIFIDRYFLRAPEPIPIIHTLCQLLCSLCRGNS
jgi:hypothetical protein